MNKILIVDASDSDRRLMVGLLTRAGYEPIAVETMEAAKDEVVLSPWRSQRSVERNDGGCKRRGGETSTGRSDCRGDEIRPWHSAGVNQLAED